MPSLFPKSYVAKPGSVPQKWHLVDAEGKRLGRLASDIAMILMGKHRATYTPHVDTGDFVVVVNVEKMLTTGKKWQLKEYTWNTGYPGLRTEPIQHRYDRAPERVLSDAVRRMLPKNKLAVKMLNKLKMYRGSEHPHQAQNPQPKELAG